MNITYTEISCKFCNSKNVIRYGHFKNEQRWWCKDCERKFADNGALPGMKTPTNQISSAISMYYEGMSLNAIRRQIEQDHNNYPSDSTVYEWIDKYTQKIADEAGKYTPKVGDRWIADETYVRIDKSKANVKNPYSKSRSAKWVIFWDIIDADTRFLLASHLTTTRNKNDAKILMEKASKRAGKIPKFVVTDKLNSYLDGIELAYGADAKHKAGSPFEIENNTNLIERFHGTLKARTKVMRALKTKDTLQKFTDGWLAYYNFLRPHESLDGKTPAHKAGIKFKYKNWNDVVISDSPIVQVEKPAKARIVITEEIHLLHNNKPKISMPRIRITPPRRSIRGSRIQYLGAGIVRHGGKQHIKLY